MRQSCPSRTMNTTIRAKNSDVDDRRQGRRGHCNAAFAHVSGYSMDELMGQPHNLIRHPDMPPEAYKDL